MTERPATVDDRPFVAPFARDAAAALAHPVVTVLRAAAFWLAVALPLLYPPLLLGGLDGGEMTTFALLLGCNGLALLFGHGYGAVEE